MAERNPKRAKMDNPGTSSSTRPEKLQMKGEGELINKGTQNFEVIRNMRGFVDHTHFIQSFLLKKEPKLAIFAPRRFGKSSHLNMVKKFLQIDVDQRTGKASSTVNESADTRKNYKLFDGTRVITDVHHKDLVEDHLGKHPVIHLDFKKPSIASVKKAFQHFRMVVHEAYLEHFYLETSTKLVPDNKRRNAACQNICRRWCCDKEYKKQDLDGCLKFLSEFLYNHFDGAKVYILVDEFDAVNASALRKVRGKSKRDTVDKLRDICTILAEILGPVTKGCEDYVAGALITGVSYITGIGYSSDMNNFTKFRFLEGDSIFPRDQDFVPFYGATEWEVRSLIEKLVQDDRLASFKENEKFHNDQHKLDVRKIMLDVESRYNGYIDENGTRIFCLWSVLQYLETGKPKDFWHQTEGVKVYDLRNVFQCAAIAIEVLKLMHGDTITFDRDPAVRVEQLLQLEEFIADDTRDANRTVLFNFLMDQGFVSYAERKLEDEAGKFKMPNAEIRAAFSQALHDVLKEWDFDAMSCAELVNKLSKHDDEKTLQEKMLAIHKELKCNYKKFESKDTDYINETLLMCALYEVINKSSSFEIAIDSHIKKDGKPVSSGRPDFLLLQKSSNFCIVWELKHNKEEKDGKMNIKKTSKYALQEARGMERTTHDKVKDYMKTIETLKLDALYIGLSVDGNFNVSLSYASKNEEKIFCITKKEHELHSDYYSGCEMLPENESDSDTQQ